MSFKVYDYGHTHDQPLNSSGKEDRTTTTRVENPTPIPTVIPDIPHHSYRGGGTGNNIPRGVSNAMSPQQTSGGGGERRGRGGRRWMRGMMTRGGGGGIGRGGHFDRNDERINRANDRRSDTTFESQRRPLSSPAAQEQNHNIFCMNNEREERCRNQTPENSIYRGEESNYYRGRGGRGDGHRGYNNNNNNAGRGRGRGRGFSNSQEAAFSRDWNNGDRDERFANKRPFRRSHSRERFNNSGEPDIGSRINRRRSPGRWNSNYHGRQSPSRSRSPRRGSHNYNNSRRGQGVHQSGRSNIHERTETFVPRSKEAESSNSGSNVQQNNTAQHNETNNDPRLRRKSGSIYSDVEMEIPTGIAVKYREAEDAENASTLSAPGSSQSTITTGDSVSTPLAVIAQPSSPASTLIASPISDYNGSPNESISSSPSSIVETTLASPNNNNHPNNQSSTTVGILTPPTPVTVPVPSGPLSVNPEKKKDFHVPLPSAPLPSASLLLEDHELCDSNAGAVVIKKIPNPAIAITPTTPTNPDQSPKEKERANNKTLSNIPAIAKDVDKNKKDTSMPTKPKPLVENQDKILQNVVNRTNNVVNNPGNCIISSIPNRLRLGKDSSKNVLEEPVPKQKTKEKKSTTSTESVKTTRSSTESLMTRMNKSQKKSQKSTKKNPIIKHTPKEKTTKTSTIPTTKKSINKRKRTEKLTSQLFGFSTTEKDKRTKKAKVSKSPNSEEVSDNGVVFVECQAVTPSETLDKTAHETVELPTSSSTPEPEVQPQLGNEDNSTQPSIENNDHVQQPQTDIDATANNVTSAIASENMNSIESEAHDDDERSYTLQIYSPVSSAASSPLSVVDESENNTCRGEDEDMNDTTPPQICSTTTPRTDDQPNPVHDNNNTGSNDLQELQDFPHRPPPVYSPVSPASPPPASPPPSRLDNNNEEPSPRSSTPPISSSAFTNLQVSPQVFSESSETVANSSPSVIINPCQTREPTQQEEVLTTEIASQQQQQQSTSRQNICEIIQHENSSSSRGGDNHVSVITSTTSNVGVTTSTSLDDDDDDQEMIRIRRDDDLFTSTIDDRMQSIIKDLEIKSKTIARELSFAINNLNSSLQNRDSSVSEKLTQFKTLRGTMIKCQCVMDLVNVRLQAEDILTHKIPDSFNFENVQKIPIEEMADYFLKILVLGFFLKEPACAMWETNLKMLHYRLCRVLNFYVNVKESEGHLQNIFMAINPRIRQYTMIAFQEVTKIWEQVRFFHRHQEVDKNCVLFEQSQLGFKGFASQVDAIVCKVRGMVYRKRGMIAPPQDSASQNYSFENDMKILFEIRGAPPFQQQQEP